jgi:hypothetical protein
VLIVPNKEYMRYILGNAVSKKYTFYHAGGRELKNELLGGFSALPGGTSKCSIGGKAAKNGQKGHLRCPSAHRPILVHSGKVFTYNHSFDTRYQ